MSMLGEFKQFAMRGNVIDMAVGVVIGAAFGKIVSTLVAEVIMPIVGVLTGGVDFSDMALALRDAQGEHPAVVLGYGKLVQVSVDFIIVAFVIFLVVKLINSMKRKAEEKPAAPPAPSAEEKLLTEIRDLLKARGA